MFGSIYSEQREILFFGKNDVSSRTAEKMLKRLEENYYSKEERLRIEYVLKKNGYLNGKSSQRFDNVENEKTPLDIANETIRKANKRISELKKENYRLMNRIDGHREEIASLKIKLSEANLRKNNASYTELEILGFSSLPTKSELRKKYKMIASIYHPDKGGSTQFMQRINDAYDNLSSSCL